MCHYRKTGRFFVANARRREPELVLVGIENRYGVSHLGETGIQLEASRLGVAGNQVLIAKTVFYFQTYTIQRNHFHNLAEEAPVVLWLVREPLFSVITQIELILLWETADSREVLEVAEVGETLSRDILDSVHGIALREQTAMFSAFMLCWG